MDTANQAKNKFKARLSEFAIATVLTVILLFILNYFDLISLSNINRVFSFLPQKSQNAYQSFDLSQADLVVRQIISNPQVISNSQNKFNLVRIEKSSMKPIDLFKIDFEATIATGSGEGSGLLFSDDPFNDGTKISMVYYASGRSWILKYSKGKISKSLILYATEGIPYAKFSLTISRDGKRLVALLPSGTTRTMQLSESIFSTNSFFTAYAILGPSSAMEVSTLRYVYIR